MRYSCNKGAVWWGEKCEIMQGMESQKMACWLAGLRVQDITCSLPLIMIEWQHWEHGWRCRTQSASAIPQTHLQTCNRSQLAILSLQAAVCLDLDMNRSVSTAAEKFQSTADTYLTSRPANMQHRPKKHPLHFPWWEALMERVRPLRCRLIQRLQDVWFADIFHQCPEKWFSKTAVIEWSRGFTLPSLYTTDLRSLNILANAEVVTLSQAQGYLLYRFAIVVQTTLDLNDDLMRWRTHKLSYHTGSWLYSWIQRRPRKKPVIPWRIIYIHGKSCKQIVGV